MSSDMAGDSSSLVDVSFDADMPRPEFLDPIDSVRASKAYSFSNEAFAEAYVDAILAQAEDHFKPRNKPYRVRDIVSPLVSELVTGAAIGLPVDTKSQSDTTTVTTPCVGYLPLTPEKELLARLSRTSSTFSGWPKISEFNIKLGLEKLEEYIECYIKSDEWMCCVEFLGFESEETSNYFVYEVEFSIPTPLYPIPQATASAFFSLEVSKIVPPSHDRCIDVSFVLEYSHVILSRGSVQFQDIWIKDIARCKRMIFRKLTF